jgi:phosphate binding protein
MRRVSILGVLAGLALVASSLAADPVQIKGSDTIGGELGPSWARRYMETHPGEQVSVEALGSSTGFQGLFDGSADLAASSRPAEAREIDRARDLGLTLQEYVVGYDGIAVIVHPDNPVSSLTVSQLALVFSGAVARWNAIGGEDRPIRALSRPSYSGTHAFFREKVLQSDFGAGVAWVEHNRDLVAQVAGDRSAVSYVGLGWVSPEVKALSIAVMADQQPVAPTTRSIGDGSYPISRPLMLYTGGPPSASVRRFLRFVFSKEGRHLVSEHGFVPSDFAPSLNSPTGQGDPDDSGASLLLRVRFGSGGSALTAESRAALRPFVDRALSAPCRIVVAGHADATGNEAVNRQVSLQRARAVASYLVSLGVPVDLVSVRGAGSDQPIASNDTAAGREANRRVDLQLVPVR